MRGAKSPIKSFVENPRDLEKFESVHRWLSTVRQDGIGSDKTEANYLLFLNKYCGFWGKTPDQLIEERKRELKSEDEVEQRRAEEQLREFGNYLEQKLKRRGGSMKTYHGAIRSFYSANYVELKMKTPPRRSEQRLPARKEDIIKVLKYANLRDRALILGLKDSGISAEDFVKLTYADIQYEFEKGIVPICISLVREKSQIPYHTFLGSESVEALRDYLEERKRRGEEITGNSPLFDGIYKNTKLTTEGLSSVFWRLSKQTGIIISSHRLRKYFETYVVLGLVRGSTAFLPKYWTGHSLGVDSHYVIPPVEEQREAYRQAYPSLALTTKEEVSEEQRRIIAAEDSFRAALVLKGLPKEEIARRLELFKTAIQKRMEIPEAIEEATRGLELLPELKKRVRRTAHNGGDCATQKIVSEEELETYLNQGWRVTAALPSGKIIIEAN